MIRQDKITFLISTLETPELYSFLISEEAVHDNDFDIDYYSERIFKRIGIVSREEQNLKILLTRYIPVNKHNFLKESLRKLSGEYCFKKSPICVKCYLSIGCDYYNKKNDWL